MAVWLTAAAAALISFAAPSREETLDAITFAHGATLYVPLREIGGLLGLGVAFSKEGASLGGRAPAHAKALPSGKRIVSLADLRPLGGAVTWDAKSNTAHVTLGQKAVRVKPGGKRVIVDKSTQVLEAYQGNWLVLKSHVSSGREGHATPNGDYKAGPLKERMHRSRKYDWAPMPWSVQVDGDIFIHGYEEVPRRPASHGCIRLPLDGSNPARWFYQWVDIGTPITIKGEWSENGSRG